MQHWKRFSQGNEHRRRCVCRGGARRGRSMHLARMPPRVSPPATPVQISVQVGHSNVEINSKLNAPMSLAIVGLLGAKCPVFEHANPYLDFPARLTLFLARASAAKEHFCRQPGVAGRTNPIRQQPMHPTSCSSPTSCRCCSRLQIYTSGSCRWSGHLLQSAQNNPCHHSIS